jgi:hypothetical protein
MRHRELQKGLCAGSIGWRRQYTQRGSDSAKPAHCIADRRLGGPAADRRERVREGAWG